MKQHLSIHNEYYDTFKSPLGVLYIIFTYSAVTGISFHKPENIICRRTEKTQAAIKELSEYFEKGRKEFTFETKFKTGTVFEKSVWNILKEIPYGETRTYKWIAEKIGNPLASRAVGNALSKNPLPIVFPCHRVIESDGSIGGYSEGIDLKRRLLEIEYYIKLSE